MKSETYITPGGKMMILHHSVKSEDALVEPAGTIAPPRFAAIYIAGPMTGLPEYNYPAFHAAAKRWRDAGWFVENPAETFDLDDPQTATMPYEGFLRSAIQQLVCGCEAIALLPGWQDSKGARLEAHVARALKMAFFDAETMQAIETPRGDLSEKAPENVHRTYTDSGAESGEPRRES